MDSRSQPVSAPPPGADPVALRVITAAVLAGLMVTAAVAVWSAPLPGSPSGLTSSARGQAGPGRTQAHRAVMAPDQPAAAGLALLTRAAQACRSVPYQGVEVLAWTGTGGASTSVVQVWHRPGGQALTKPVPVATEWPRQNHRAVPIGDGSTAGVDADGVLGVSQRLLALLGANYTVTQAGHGTVIGRPARIVAVRHRAGGLAARFWLDDATMLPLRRELFDPQGRVVSDTGFAELKTGQDAVTGVPGPAARSWGITLASAQLARLRAGGWPLPGPLPGNLTLVGAREDITPSGPVIDLDYSDGLSVVSIFVQRGHLPPALTGWSRVALEGHRVYADDPDGESVAWSARGFVYTLISAAPRQTVGPVVAALPHDSRPGLLSRIGRGLHRLFSWAHP